MELIWRHDQISFAVKIFVYLASSLKPDYPSEQLVDVLLETVIRAATSAVPGIKDSQRRRAQMQALYAQGVGRFLVLPRIRQKFGLLKKIAPRQRRR